MAVRIVTDSSCDLTDEEIAAHGVEVVPLTIRFGDEELEDRSELSVEEFYARLAGSAVLPETAAPAPGKFEAAFRRQQEAIMHRIDSRPFLKDVRCPTLVVAGREDQLMPVEVLKELADGMPGARLTVIEDCGHMAALEQPARVLEAFFAWLERKTT